MITYNQKFKIDYSTKINSQDFISGFTTKEWGDCQNVENITNFLSKNNIAYDKLIIPEQVHGDSVYKLDTGIHIEKTDGVITSQNNIVLTVITADCVPIIFADKKGGIIGVSHQGWKGTFKRLAVKMIDKMVEAGAKKENIIAAIGPAIGDCCYDIEEERYELLSKAFPDYSDKIFRKRNGKIYLNLSYLNYLQLSDSGIKKSNIDFFPFCTSCQKDKFYSYRRDSKETFGEMVSFIVKYNHG